MGWVVLASRNATGSPGSGDWSEHLCARSIDGGYEFTVCAFEFDGNVDEPGSLIADPNYVPIQINDVHQGSLGFVLKNLGWRSADLPIVLSNWPR